MILYLKVINGQLIPDNEDSAKFLFQCKSGQVLKADVKRPRNYEFHKKYFALLDYAFDVWEQTEIEYKGQIVQKNKDKFRKDIQIMAGYGEPVVNLRGDVQYISKSISFGSMSAEDFETLYSKVINVILQKVLQNHTRDDLDRVVEEILRFS